MAEKKVAKKKSREVLIDPMTRDSRAPLSETLDRVRKYVEKTEFEPVDGVTADALDVVERGSNITNLIKRIRASRLPTVPSGGPTIPLKFPSDPVRVTLKVPSDPVTPEQAAKWKDAMNKHGKVSKWSKFAKFLGAGAKKLPGANAGVLAYETMSLINSPEARQKARDQAEEMYKRGGTVGGNLKNMAQGYLDPVGTMYAAGDAVADTVGTYAGLAYDKLFGPSEEEQIAAARYRSSKRRERLRLERMSPEQRAEREKRLKQAETQLEQMEAQSNSRPVVRSVLSPLPDSALAYQPAIRKIPKQQLERRPRGR